MNGKLQSRFLLFLVSAIIIPHIHAQEPVFQTFRDTRIINTQSIETLPRKELDFRISHRFGDMFGDNGGWSTLYGLENAADILFGFDYGISDYVTVGISRTKGNGPLQKLINATIKLNVQDQNDQGTSPFSIAIVGMTSFSTMGKSSNPEDINYFNSFFERNILNGQLLMARKFSDRFSLQISGGYTYRNIVEPLDQNGLTNLGVAFRFQLSKILSIVGDYTVPLSNYRSSDNGFHNPLGIGFEFDTGGHVFQFNFTNARGIVETDFIPYTRSSWGDGEFRLGFTISRHFNL